MKIRESFPDRILDAVIYALLALALIASLYPFWHVLIASFSDPYRISIHQGVLLLPKGWSLSSYQSVLSNAAIWTGYRNTIAYVVIGVSVNMTMTIIGGFVLSRSRLKMRNAVMLGIVFTMIFKGGLVPNYIVVRSLGLYDTLWAIVLPSAINTMNLVIMRTGFSSIPESLEESAKMDGASDILVLLRIFLPMALPTITTLVLYYAVSRWNAWFSAFIYLRSRDQMPLQIILREILIENSMGETNDGVSAQEIYRSETYKYCTIIISTVPILLLYPFIQRYFVKGAMIGAIKG